MDDNDVGVLKMLLDAIHSGRAKKMASGGQSDVPFFGGWVDAYNQSQQPGGAGSDVGGFIGSMLDPPGFSKSGMGNEFKAVAPTTGYEGTGYDYGADVNAANAAQMHGNAGQDAQNVRLANQAKGIGPSISQMQLEKATQANIQNSAGQAASQRGMNPAMAQRAAMQQASSANQEVAGQATMARLMEQRQAEQQLQAGLQTQRGQNLGQYGQAMSGWGSEAGRGLQSGIANAQMNLGAQTLQEKVAAGNAAGSAQQSGGMMGGLGSMMQMGKAHGGVIRRMDDGGDAWSGSEPMDWGQAGNDYNYNVSGDNGYSDYYDTSSASGLGAGLDPYASGSGRGAGIDPYGSGEGVGYGEPTDTAQNVGGYEMQRPQDTVQVVNTAPQKKDPLKGNASPWEIVAGIIMAGIQNANIQGARNRGGYSSLNSVAPAGKACGGVVRLDDGGDVQDGGGDVQDGGGDVQDGGDPRDTPERREWLSTHPQGGVYDPIFPGGDWEKWARDHPREDTDDSGDSVDSEENDDSGDTVQKKKKKKKSPFENVANMFLSSRSRGFAYPVQEAYGGTIRPLSLIDIPDKSIRMDEGGVVDAEKKRAALEGYLRHVAPQQEIRLDPSLNYQKRRAFIEALGEKKSDGGPLGMMRDGGRVPGRAPVPVRDDPRRDTVPALLSPSEKVVPASITQAHDAPAKSAAFVGALDAGANPKAAKRVAQKTDRENLGSILDRLAALEKTVKGKR